MKKTAALTFIAHGSPKKEANVFIKKLSKKIGGGKPVNLGFLNFGRPNVKTALNKHIENGYTKIRIVPLFLVPGKHVRTDIPKIIKKFKGDQPKIAVTIDDFIGNDNHFIDFLKEKI